MDTGGQISVASLAAAQNAALDQFRQLSSVTMPGPLLLAPPIESETVGRIRDYNNLDLAPSKLLTSSSSWQEFLVTRPLFSET